MPFGEFPNQKDEQSDGRHDGERHDLPGLEPVEILALVEQDLQRPHPNDEKRQAHLVDRHLDGGRLTLAIDDPRRESRAETHRHIDVEDPRPGDVVGDPAAEQRPDHRRHHRRDGPDR